MLLLRAPLTSAFVRPSSIRNIPSTRVLTSRQSSSLPGNVGAAAPIEADLIEFRSLGLIEPLINALASSGFERPSPIQRATIPEVLRGQNIAFAATTGSGKTLAYLLPAVQGLKGAEALQDENDELPVKRPRVLILVPTRELAEQVLGVAKQVGSKSVNHRRLHTTYRYDYW